MKNVLILCVIATALVSAIGVASDPSTPPAAATAPAATAPAPVAAADTVYTTTDTPVGDLLDNPKTRAILDQDVPGFTTADQIDSARGMTLKAIQQYAPDMFSDAVLAKIDADLAKLAKH